MESSETNGEGQPAGWKARDGRVWFPTVQGLVVIDPKTIEVNEVPAPVVIEQIKADEEVIFGDDVAADVRRLTSTRSAERRARNEGQSFSSAATMKLGPGRARVVEFRYTANTFADPKRARFRYRLVGHDPGWRDETAERVAHYTNLRPGSYRFEVTAANHHGIWNPTPASFAFSLAPHFYETVPFYALCAAGVVLIGLALHYWRVGFLGRIERLERERALQVERVRIAQDLHDDLGANLTGFALKVDLARRKSSQPQELSAQLKAIADGARAMVNNMRATVWTLNPRQDTLESLARFLAELAENLTGAAGLRCRLELPERLPALMVPSPIRHHLHLAVKEALNNAAKHAAATEIRLTLEVDGDELRVSVADDGRGFISQPSTLNPQPALTGNGLANMRQRIAELGGAFELNTAPGQGTRVTIRLPTKSFRR